MSNEVLRLEAILSNWRHFAQTSIAKGANSLDDNEICKLQNATKELQKKQNKDNNHQLEVAVLQNVN